MTAPRRLSAIYSTNPNLLVPDNERDFSALPASPADGLEFSATPSLQLTLFDSSTSTRVAVEHGRSFKRSFHAILQPLTLILLCLLIPSAVLLTLTIYYRVDMGQNLFEILEDRTDLRMVYVDVSATILTNISSVSSTLAPFLIALIMEIWSPFIVQALVEASQENARRNQPLPTPFQFSLLVSMAAGRFEKAWKFLFNRQQSSRKRPLILRQTTIILFISLCLTLLTFLGDQFFHIWSESVNINRYTVPGTSNSFGRGLTPECITFNRVPNRGWPCTVDNLLPHQEYAERENEISYISTNTSRINQINFLTATDLPQGDLAVLWPATGVVPSYVDYRASTLGVSTQCLFLTPTCKVKHLSDILTQFNCSENFFGVLGKPANISYNMFYKAQDPDVPGLAWKISPSLEFMFHADANLQVPYNVMGYNIMTGNNDLNLGLLPDSKLVNPVFLTVAGRVTTNDIAIDSTVTTKAASRLFLSTYYGNVFDFFLNCSYTTYDVEYTVVDGTIQSDFTFTPTPNGSVAEEWHGQLQYVSLDGDPSSGLASSNLIAAKQKTPDDFARTWANLYSVRVLAVIGAYTNPRLNMQEQIRDRLIVTRIMPWTLGFLLAANIAYALLGVVVSTIAFTVSTRKVLEMSEKMDLNKQIAGRYSDVAMDDFGKANEMGLPVEESSQQVPDNGIRVGIIGDKFESLYYASLRLGNLFNALKYIVEETTCPQSQIFAEKLLSQLRKHQVSDDCHDLAGINDTLEEWKKSNYRDKWTVRDIDNSAARSMTYVLQLAHASELQRQCFFFSEFSRRHEEQELRCGDHFHFRGGPQGPPEFQYFWLQDPFIYTVETWGELSDTSYLLPDTKQSI